MAGLMARAARSRRPSVAEDAVPSAPGVAGVRDRHLMSVDGNQERGDHSAPRPRL